MKFIKKQKFLASIIILSLSCNAFSPSILATTGDHDAPITPPANPRIERLSDFFPTQIAHELQNIIDTYNYWQETDSARIESPNSEINPDNVRAFINTLRNNLEHEVFGQILSLAILHTTEFSYQSAEYFTEEALNTAKDLANQIIGTIPNFELISFANTLLHNSTRTRSDSRLSRFYINVLLVFSKLNLVAM